MSKEINVAFIGLGNCASSLIQGIGYYEENHLIETKIPGLITDRIGKYTIGSINIVSAIDVNIEKIGLPISQAIFQHPNCAKIFHQGNLFSELVIPGPVLDGISERMKGTIKLHDITKSILEWEEYIVNELISKKVDVLVSYLPVGSKEASKFYANCALKAKVAFANAMPEFICSTSDWSERFLKAGVPCAGDDIKSQIGATIIHRALVDLIHKRGQIIDNTFQLNVGGNTDFENMLDEERLISKRISKTEAVTSLVADYDFPTRIGPSDYVPHLNDNKICYINVIGKQFGGVQFSIDVKLSVEDSPNSAGVMVDVIRLLKLAKDKGLGGYQEFSSYYFKHPMYQFDDHHALNIVKDFIA
ncbi:MAG: inositol-3-phosphate synthase [Candidatus Gracilibacteria bacterium]|nr:inositol-3-phosphate synthase [Candidatus Gracilibacteria bacterium]